MNILKRAWQWLFTKHQKESTVTDTAAISTDTTTTDATDSVVANTADTANPADTTATTTTTTVTTDDSVLDEVKSLLVKIGHDVESEWDEVVALAKKLVTKSAS
ncbi:hypothetical protein [Pantoea sp.]|uniref:hypothetical protein n=1 Tax=Pantoea sp. TaxID=69393 RepID=UPI0028A64D13|nr:hypothetical protein [Pantoea sp.]